MKEADRAQLRLWDKKQSQKDYFDEESVQWKQHPQVVILQSKSDESEYEFFDGLSSSDSDSE
ncbi:hypothetical protein PMIN04_009537 [Paraphaeosphaeria minitans]